MLKELALIGCEYQVVPSGYVPRRKDDTMKELMCWVIKFESKDTCDMVMRIANQFHIVSTESNSTCMLMDRLLLNGDEEGCTEVTITGHLSIKNIISWFSQYIEGPCNIHFIWRITFGYMLSTAALLADEIEIFNRYTIPHPKPLLDLFPKITCSIHKDKPDKPIQY